MTKLKTLKELEHKMTFHDKLENGDDLDMHCTGFKTAELRELAKKHITKLCTDMNLDEKRIDAGFYSKEGIFTFKYEQAKNDYETMAMTAVAWIKYFFNLEE